MGRQTSSDRMPAPTVEVKSVNLAICISPMLIYGESQRELLPVDRN
jgi:hypothetical protein